MTNWKIFAVLVALSLVTACQRPADDSKADEEKEVEPVPVEVATATRGDVDALYTGTASLEADGEAVIKAKVSGEIVALLVEEGDQVKSGQPLAKIDAARLQLEQTRAKANLEKMRQDYQRNVELHEKGLLPAGTFEGMKFDLDALKAAYDLSRLELSYTTIRAPIDGVVSARNIKIGNNVVVGEEVFVVTDLDPLLAYLHVPERDFQKLIADQNVDLRVDALPGKSFNGQIARISPVVDAATGTFKVTVEVSDDSGALKPGMFGRINIIYETFPDAVLIPRNAVVDNDGTASVFLVDDNIAIQREIKTGHFSGAKIQVTNGLNGGETIVVIGQNGLKDNGPVKVVNEEDNEAPKQANQTTGAVAHSD